MASIDKTAMLTGWFMGRRVAGLMKPQEAPAQWLTIFDGEATTVADKSGVEYAVCQPDFSGRIAGGHTYRVTLNGVTYITLAQSESLNMHYVGNAHLWKSYVANSYTGEDTGENFCIRSWATGVGFGAGDWVYTRTPGTYKLKIERLVETTE